MRLTIFSFKGGVAKTTTALSFAALMSERGPTLLIDGDPNQSAGEWAEEGNPAFAVLPLESVDADSLEGYAHIVIDTAARPSDAELKDLAQGSDLIVVPCPPDAFALRALLKTTAALERTGVPFKVLLTMVPPFPSRDGLEARKLLEEAGLPMFKAEIRRAAVFTKAALLGQVARDVKGDSRAAVAWMDYEAAGKELGL